MTVSIFQFAPAKRLKSMPGSGGANWHALLTPQTSACVFPAPAQGGTLGANASLWASKGIAGGKGQLRAYGRAGGGDADGSRRGPLRKASRRQPSG